MTEKLYGKPVAETIRASLKQRIEALKAKGVEPAIAIVRVGSRPDDVAYEKRVIKICDEVGVSVRQELFDEQAEESALRERITELGTDDSVHGIMMFRPLPRSFDEDAIVSLINPVKDVDCMNQENLKKLFTGDRSAIAPCTPEAVVEILKYYDYNLEGSNVVIANRSLVLGKPLSMLFLNENATVTICHSRTKNLAELVKGADIFVSGIGKPKFFGRDSVCERNTVIDVGINFSEEGTMCGDCNTEDMDGLVKAITPVPGGVGIVTSTILVKHVVDSAERFI